MTSAMTRRLYVIAWLMLGAIALVYFFTLLQPYLGLGSAQMTSSLFARSEKRDEPAGSADPSLSQALVRMRSEIERLKGTLETANKENFALKDYIKTLEAAFGPTTASISPQKKNPEPGILKEEAASQSAPPPKVDITMLDMPADGFAENFPEAPLPIAGQAPPKRTLFAVELAAGLKASALDARWSELKRSYPKLLTTLQPRSIKARPGAGGGAERHKLIAGPFENAAAAARLCARLTAVGARCEGAVFSGTAIGDVAAR